MKIEKFFGLVSLFFQKNYRKYKKNQVSHLRNRVSSSSMKISNENYSVKYKNKVSQAWGDSDQHDKQLTIEFIDDEATNVSIEKENTLKNTNSIEQNVSIKKIKNPFSKLYQPIDELDQEYSRNGSCRRKHASLICENTKKEKKYLMLFANILNKNVIPQKKKYKKINDIALKYEQMCDNSLKNEIKEAAKKSQTEMLLATDNGSKKEIFDAFKCKFLKSFYFEQLLNVIKTTVLKEKEFQDFNGLQNFFIRLENEVCCIKKCCTLSKKENIIIIIQKLIDTYELVAFHIRGILDNNYNMFLVLNIKFIPKGKKDKLDSKLYVDKFITSNFLMDFNKFKMHLSDLHNAVITEKLASKETKSYEEFMYERVRLKIEKLLEYMRLFVNSRIITSAGPCLLVYKVEHMIVTLIKSSNIFEDVFFKKGHSINDLNLFFIIRGNLAELYNLLFRSESCSTAERLNLLVNMKEILNKTLTSTKSMKKIMSVLHDLLHHAYYHRDYRWSNYINGILIYYNSAIPYSYMENIKLLPEAIENILPLID
ncbi:hypothetical protein SLOPH_482 [Spraguea lophii 42_110]|uniref:Uncharacterized protein n=1 Tax=Spraguea lophii (strain 42_110) TaxID=1358809 RepID=S7XLE9_SPRLO|nr:hypothetical protein SLOPH_482 [Spraguea lophii 42_110]